MATAVATSKRGRGNSRDQLTVSLHVQAVEQDMRDGYPRYEIVARMAKKGVSARVVDRHMAKIRTRWKVERLLRSETIVEERLNHLHERARWCWNKKGLHTAAVQLEKEIDLIYGIHEAQKVDHRVAAVVQQAPAQIPRVEVADLDDTTLELLERALDGARVEAPPTTPALPGAVLEAVVTHPRPQGEDEDE